MGAGVFHGRVRDGIGCIILAMATGPPGRILCGVGVEGVCVCVVRFGAARGPGVLMPWPVRWWWGDEICWAIRTAWLRGLLHFHLRPIDVLVLHGPWGGLVLREVSRLDAFSGYPVRTWLPSDATGVTTGAPEVRPSRSSRTRDGSSQASYTHGRLGPNCLTTF